MAYPMQQQIPQISDDDYNQFLNEVEKELQVSRNNLTVQRQRMLNARLQKLEQSEAETPNPIRDESVFKDQATQTGVAGQAYRIGSLATQQMGGNIVALANRAFEAVGLSEEGSTDAFNEYQADLNRWFNKKSVEDETDLISPGWEQATTGTTRSLGEMAISGFIGKAALGTKSLMTGVWENATNPAFLGAIGFAGANRGNQALTEAQAADLFNQNKYEWSTPYIYAAVAAANEMGIAAAFQRFGMGGLEARMFGRKTLWDGIGSATKKLGIDLTHEMTEELLTEVLDYSWSAMNDVEDFTPEGLFDVIDMTARQVLLSMGTVGSVQETSNYLNDPRRQIGNDAYQRIQARVTKEMSVDENGNAIEPDALAVEEESWRRASIAAALSKNAAREIDQGSQDYIEGMVRFQTGSGGVHSRARYVPLSEAQAFDQFAQGEGITTEDAGVQREEKKHFWKKEEMLRPGGALAFATTYPDRAEEIANTNKPSRKMWSRIVPGIDVKEWNAEEREVFAEQLRVAIDHPGFEAIKEEHGRVISQKKKRAEVEEGMRSGDPQRIIAELRKQKEETGVTPKIEDVMRNYPVGSREDADRLLRHSFGYDYRKQREYDLHLRDIEKRDYSSLDKLPWHQLRRLGDELGVKSTGSKDQFVEQIRDAMEVRFRMRERGGELPDSPSSVRGSYAEQGQVARRVSKTSPKLVKSGSMLKKDELVRIANAMGLAMHGRVKKKKILDAIVFAMEEAGVSREISTLRDAFKEWQSLKKRSAKEKMMGSELRSAIVQVIEDVVDGLAVRIGDYATFDEIYQELAARNVDIDEKTVTARLNEMLSDGVIESVPDGYKVVPKNKRVENRRKPKELPDEKLLEIARIRSPHVASAMSSAELDQAAILFYKTYGITFDEYLKRFESALSHELTDAAGARKRVTFFVPMNATDREFIITYSYKNAGEEWVSTSRRFVFSRSKSVVKHATFFTGTKLQNRGMGVRAFRNQIDLYQDMGIEEINVTAAEQGRFTWFRFGFVPRGNTVQDFIDAIRRNIEQNGSKELKETLLPILESNNITALQEIAAHPDGADIYRNIMHGWSGTFDLTPGSYSMEQFRSYEKGSRSKRFRKWFKESVAVDEDGYPLILFQGTNAAKAIEKDGFVSTTDLSAHYLSSDPVTSNSYAEDVDGAALIPAHVSIQNPLVFDAGGKTYNQWSSEVSIGDNVGIDSMAEVEEYAKASGHDGIIIKNIIDPANGDETVPPADVYAVFDSGQIKSIFNVGTFDAKDPRPQYSLDTDDRFEEIVNLRKADEPDPYNNDSLGEDQSAYPGKPHIEINTSDEDILGEDHVPVSAHEIIERIRKLFNIPIRYGRIRNKGAAGVYRPWFETIRLQRGYEARLTTAFHEMAHHIDKKYNLINGPGSLAEKAKNDPDLRRVNFEIAQLDYAQELAPADRRNFEGFAEYIAWLLLTESAPQHAPLFNAYFEDFLGKNPELAEKLSILKKLANRYRFQSSLDRSKFSKDGKPVRPAGETWKEWFSDKISRYINIAYQDWVDRGSILDKFDETVKEASKNSPNKNPYTRPGYTAAAMFNALSKTGPKNAYYAATDGVFSLIDPTRKLGNGLNELSKISHLDYDNFVKFAIARHTVLDAMPRNHKTGMAYLDARSIYEKFKGNEQWVKAAQELTDFNNSLLDMVAETGLITLEEAQRMKNAWEHYIPLQRVRDETKRFKQVSLGLGEKPVKGRAKGGSELMVIDPVQTTVQRAIMMYERAATHLAKKHIIMASRSVHGGVGDKDAASIGQWVEEVPANVVPTKFTLQEILSQLKSEFGLTKEDIGITDSMDPVIQMEILQTTLTIWRKDYFNHNDKPIIRVTDRGKTKLYYLDPELNAALEGIHVSQAESLAQMIFGKFTRLHKLGATGLNMSFAVTNIAADFGTWLFQRKEVDNSSVISPFEMMGIYIMSEIKKARGEKGDVVVELWQKLGGELSTYLGMDRDQIRNFVDDVIGTPAHAKPLHAMHKFTDTMRSVIGVSEVGPRLAEFRAVLERYGYTKERLERGDMPPRHIQIEAVNAAHDVTTNFKRMGIRGEVLNQYIPYINANIQSKDKFVRMIRENPTRAFFRIAVAATAHLAMYMAFVSNDDWYDEAQPWLKYGFWTFSVDGKPVIRVKRPYEWGYVATAVPEMIINAYSQRSGVPIREGLKQGSNMFLLPVKPSAITPMVETAFNYDWFREAPIDNATLMRLEPHRRFGNNTTLLSRAIAESTAGRTMGVSPNRLDHLLSGLTGGAYKNYVNIAESAFGFKKFEAGDYPGLPEPVSNAVNAGMQLGFRQTTLRKDYNKSPSEFYEEYFALERKINTHKETGIEAPEQERKRYGYLKDYADLMSAIRTARERANMTTRDGRHEYDKFITGLAREALGKERLERYPSPFGEQNLPSDIQGAVDQFLGRKVWSLTQPRVGDRRKGEAVTRYNARKTARDFEIDRAIETLTRINIDPKKLQESLRDKISSREIWLERSKRLSNRLSQ